MGSEMGKERYYNNDYQQPRSYNPLVRAAEDEMVAKLREKAKVNIEEAKKEKDNSQNVRLWLNQITPDNYDKKQSELRALMFGDRKTKGEPGYETQPETFEVEVEKQVLVVKTIFRKAQTEHSYASFYARLCGQIVRLELELKGLKP